MTTTNTQIMENQEEIKERAWIKQVSTIKTSNMSSEELSHIIKKRSLILRGMNLNQKYLENIKEKYKNSHFNEILNISEIKNEVKIEYNLSLKEKENKEKNQNDSLEKLISNKKVNEMNSENIKQNLINKEKEEIRYKDKFKSLKNKYFNQIEEIQYDENGRIILLREQKFQMIRKSYLNNENPNITQNNYFHQEKNQENNKEILLTDFDNLSLKNLNGSYTSNILLEKVNNKKNKSNIILKINSNSEIHFDEEDIFFNIPKKKVISDICPSNLTNYHHNSINSIKLQRLKKKFLSSRNKLLKNPIPKNSENSLQVSMSINNESFNNFNKSSCFDKLIKDISVLENNQKLKSNKNLMNNKFNIENRNKKMELSKEKYINKNNNLNNNENLIHNNLSNQFNLSSNIILSKNNNNNNKISIRYN